MMEPSEFLVHCQILLDESKTSEVLDSLEDEGNNTIISEVGWELVSVLCKQLTKYGDDDNLKNIEKSLLILLQYCSPKEVMLGLSEHLATESTLKSFTIVIRLCQMTFVKLERAQSKYLESLCQHISLKMVDLLQSSLNEQDEKESNQMEGSFNTTAIDTCCSFFTSMIDFLNGMLSFIGHMKSVNLESYLCESLIGKTWSLPEIEQCREIIISFIFDVLHNCVESRIFSKQSISQNDQLISNFVAFIFKFKSTSDLLEFIQQKGISECDHTGVVIFLNLLLTKCISACEIPMVHTWCFWLKLSIPFLENSLKLSSTSIVSVSLELLSPLLTLSVNKSISFDDTVDASLQSIASSLTKIMVWCQEEVMRKLSEKSFQNLLELLDKESKYLLLHSVYMETDHPGVQGYVINFILKSTQVLIEHSCKLDIVGLALLFTKIAVGENNVLHESDRYMAALNFVRFWLIKDKKDVNKTGLWNKIDQLNKNMSIMSKCVQLSKSEFKKQLEHLHDPESDPDFCTEIITSLPGGEVFPQLSKDQKFKTVCKGILHLDMMSSVIARIDEIISGK